MVTHLICASHTVLDGSTGFKFELVRENEEIPAFIVRYQGQVQGYLNRCAHIPIELDWMPGEFFDQNQTQLVCATHGATFAPDTGFCTGGPCAGQSLEKISLLEENGQIFALFPQKVQIII